MAAIEVLIWAVLGSLVLRRVLPAAVVGGLAAAFLGYGSLALVATFGELFRRQADEYFSTLPLRSCCALIALAIAVKFGRQWFDEQGARWSPRAMLRDAGVTILRPTARPTWLTVLRHLVWHEWRQARKTMLWCVAGYVGLATWLSISQGEVRSYLGILPVLATIFGASVFAADQRQVDAAQHAPFALSEDAGGVVHVGGDAGQR